MKRGRVPADKVHELVSRHMLPSGRPLVVDLEKSRGTRLRDELSGKTYLDFFMFFATSPLGTNHPALRERAFLDELAAAAVNNPSNSDFYTRSLAEFVAAMDRYAVPAELPHMFLISGGALAVENALKAAFDWKVRKNFAKGSHEEIGTKVIHFREAFHGRSGYTLSLTNTDPIKIDYFPKFAWPRVTNPKLKFPVEMHIDDVMRNEERARREIEEAMETHGDDIAALIIEPIQGEGGDNHFRPEFFRYLREVTERNEILFVLDEVQTGCGATGRFWAYEHMGVVPDIVAFGKKLQVCGILASRKLDEVDGVFKVRGRINSTWGGNLADMVRAKRVLEVIDEENLIDNARSVGDYFLAGLRKIEGEAGGLVSNSRGLGLMLAFDLPDKESRDRFVDRLFESGMIAGACGRTSVRFRPPLNVTVGEVDEALGILRAALERME